eukprot:gene9199-16873_t
MVTGETTPPPLLTEADLIALMEKHGIGTDATHAEHIETIKNRKYVGEQNDRSLVPGELGMGLVEGYDSMGFEMSKPHLRAELENDLKCICEGRKRKEDVLAEQIQKYKEVFVQASEQVGRLDDALSTYFGQPSQADPGVPNIQEQQQISEPVRKCPNCGRFDLVLRTTREGRLMLGCQGYPTCKNGIFLPKFVLKATRLASVCPRCQPSPVHKIEFEFKRGSVPPMMPLNYVSCLGGCDKELLDLIDVRDASSARPAQQQTFDRPNNLGGRGRGRDEPTRGSHNTNRGARGRSMGGNGAAGGSRQSDPSRGRGSTRGAGSSTNPQGSGRAGVARGGSTAGRFGDGNDTGFSNNSSYDGRRGNTGSDNGLGFNSRQTPGDSSVVCDCENVALLLTVRKDGPNQGRQFYKCGNDNKCNFFLWADDGQTNTGTRNAGAFPAQPNRPTASFSAGPDVGDQIKCKCNMDAVSRTVSKDGPNKGRPFYSCSKPIGQSCGFFQWGDEGDTGNQSNAAPGRGGFGGRGNWRGGRGRGASGSAPGGQKKRKCGACGEEGAEFQNNCILNFDA